MQGIFFIVGTGRSGTNLAKTMLDIHPELKVVTETHFISTLVRLYGKRKIALDEFLEVSGNHYTSSGDRRWIDLHLEARGHAERSFRSEFEAFYGKPDGNVGDLVNAFFQFCYGEGAYLLGDKTPQYGLCMSKCIELWPDAKFIHMIRDGRYAAQSMQKHSGFVRLINAGFPDRVSEYSYQGLQTTFSTQPVSMQACLQFWQRIVIAIRQEAERLPPAAYLEVRYEDLILDPVRQLRKIAKFLGVAAPWRWLGKAARKPRPFVLSRQRQKVEPVRYDQWTEEIGATLKLLGYQAGSYQHQRFLATRLYIKESVNWLIYHRLSAGLARIKR